LAHRTLYSAVAEALCRSARGFAAVGEFTLQRALQHRLERLEGLIIAGAVWRGPPIGTGQKIVRPMKGIAQAVKNEAHQIAHITVRRFCAPALNHGPQVVSSHSM
jgi:hypothetical protein